MTKSTLVLNVVIILFITGCTKTDLKPNAIMPASSQALVQANALFSSDADFTTTVTDSGTTIVNYRPNLKMAVMLLGFYYNNEGVNQNYVPELPVNAWNYLGYILTRSFIKFPKLYKFSDTITVISAKLYLYPPKDFRSTGQYRCQ